MKRAIGLHLNGQLYCPQGHYIPQTGLALDPHTATCRCGALVYVLGGFEAPDGARFAIAAAVSKDEVRHIRSARLSLRETFEFLELTWTKAS